MKCIKCNADSKLKERVDKRCSRCRHPFVFDPKQIFGDVFNDRQFERTLTLISANNTLKVTPRQFYYYLNGMKGINPGVGNGPGCFCFFLAFIVFVVGASSSNFLAMLVAPATLILIGVILLPTLPNIFGRGPRRKTIKVLPSVVSDAVQRWEMVNGEIDCLLPSVQKELPPVQVADELLDYSFDRLIVTETDDIARFLIANNFHFENNCAVLSINKYPQNLFGTIMKMLDNNPELKVYALHSCSWRGLSMLDKLRNNVDWFKDKPQVQIIDLGLLPRQFEKRPAFVEQAFDNAAASEISLDWRKNLTDKELEWLNEGNIVHLESIPPQGLLRMITLGIAMSKDPTKKDALVPVSSGDGTTSDPTGGGIFIFSSDSFG